MMDLSNISTLASGEGDLISLVVVVIIAVAGSLVQKYQKKVQERKAQAEYQHRQTERDAAERAAAYSNQPAAPIAPVRKAAPPAPLQPDARLAEHYYRTVGISVESVPKRPPTPPQRPPQRRAMADKEEESVRVGDELEIQRRRMAEQERRRQQRMFTQSPDQADTSTIVSRIVHIQSATQATFGATETAASNAFRIDDPRKAIIYYEIFSPPKALRENQGLWDY